jgi:hypothetical protein
MRSVIFVLWSMMMLACSREPRRSSISQPAEASTQLAVSADLVKLRAFLNAIWVGDGILFVLHTR